MIRWPTFTQSPSTLFRTFRARKTNEFFLIFTVVYCIFKQHHFRFFSFLFHKQKSSCYETSILNWKLKLKYVHWPICQPLVKQCGLRYFFFWHVFCQMHYLRRQKNIHQLVKKFFFKCVLLFWNSKYRLLLYYKAKH